MSSLESMIKAMSVIPLYSLKTNVTTVHKELQSYAAALDVLSEFVSEIIKEHILSTACDCGLALFEKMTGRVRTDLTLEQRREMLIRSQMLGINDNTLEGIYRFFQSVGLDCVIEENPASSYMYISAEGRDYPREEQDYIVEMAENFLPCHLDFLIDFRKADFNYFDSLNLTFDEIDSKNYTWDNFERYKED